MFMTVHSVMQHYQFCQTPPLQYMYLFQVYALDSFKTIFYKGVSHQWYIGTAIFLGFFNGIQKKEAESQ